jgi:hypothetical protein
MPTDILARISDLFSHAASGSTSSSPSAHAPARHLAKYLFPRQFCLHNVFTSPKAQNNYEVLPDYDDRELDIKVSLLARGGRGEIGLVLTRQRFRQKLGPVKTPKRLKGVLDLLERMIKLHSRCKPRKLLDRHCPSKASPSYFSFSKAALTPLSSAQTTQAPILTPDERSSLLVSSGSV